MTRAIAIKVVVSGQWAAGVKAGTCFGRVPDHVSHLVTGKFSIDGLGLSEHHGKDGVRTTAFIVHVGRSHCPGLIPFVHESFNLL